MESQESPRVDAMMDMYLCAIVYSSHRPKLELRLTGSSCVYSLCPPKMQRFLSCRSLKRTLESLWLLVRRRTVWQPMSFVAWCVYHAFILEISSI